MFSSRTQWNTAPTRLHDAWLQRQQTAEPCFDLTASNPTIAGFSFDLAGVSDALALGALATYDPVPFGLPQARAAVADYYLQSHCLAVSPERILLTVSTSEAYSFLFRLLCDPGDEVLYLQPGYPLFDYLAELDNVRLRPVAWLQDADGWHLDRGGLEASHSDRTRAVLVVHPNNPTGHFTSESDRCWLDAWCARHGLALIVDEVFLDYPLGQSMPSYLTAPAQAATFVLSGISKISGLPQMKVAWIVLHGSEELVREAADRLDVIADTFLSLSTPLQLGLPALLAVRQQIQPQILQRLRRNLATLDACLAAATVVTRLPVEAGWYVSLRIPAHQSAEASALELLNATGIYLHPGDFFGYATPGIWVLSLLTAERSFSEAIPRLISHIQHFE